MCGCARLASSRLPIGSGTIQAEVAGGVLQHLQDDRWFHQTAAFYETCGELTVLFRNVVGSEDGYRPGFLGHIVLELLLDGVLIEEQPGMLDAYYRRLAEVDPDRGRGRVNRMAREPTSRLAMFIPLFHREQFLRDYLDPARLLYRLNQVMRRIKLNQLPDEVADVSLTRSDIVTERVARVAAANIFDDVIFPERIRNPQSEPARDAPR